MSWFIIGRQSEISKSYALCFLQSLNVFATVVQLQMKKLGIADVTVHYQEIGTWQMIPSSFPKVWRILDLFLPLFCFPKQEGESLRFFWGLGRGKKLWDVEVRSGPVAISREKKTHLFSSFSLCRSKTRRSWANSFRVSHQHWHSRDQHQNEFQVFEIHGHLPERKELGQLPEKKMRWRSSLSQIFFKYFYVWVFYCILLFLHFLGSTPRVTTKGGTSFWHLREKKKIWALCN